MRVLDHLQRSLMMGQRARAKTLQRARAKTLQRALSARARISDTDGGGSGNGSAHAGKTRERDRGGLSDLSMFGSENTKRVVIDAIGLTSFTISGVRVVGSMLVLPHLPTYWNVREASEISGDSLALLRVHTPRPDMLIVGTGERAEAVHSDIYKYMRQLGIGIEVMSTHNACQTFNVLNQEGRSVAAALIPRSHQW